MMKFVINTNYDREAPAYRFCVTQLSEWLRENGQEVTIQDWENYDQYEVALFMPYDPDIERAKKQNPKILTGLMDPKLMTESQRQAAKEADFLMVSSIEQKDAFAWLNKNIFIFYMFPEIEEREKEHQQKEKIIIGYHGNKQHLDAMRNPARALSRLAKKYDLEFWAVYDVRSLGKWKKNVPKMKVKHIQWELDSYQEYLHQCDIGVVPSMSTVGRWVKRITTIPFWLSRIAARISGYNEGKTIWDYLIRYKYSTGPGRVPIFSWLGLPVVADMYASTGQVILDEESGMLAYSEEGWYNALERLIKNPELRSKLAENSRKYFNDTLSRERTYNKMLEFIRLLKK